MLGLQSAVDSPRWDTRFRHLKKGGGGGGGNSGGGRGGGGSGSGGGGGGNSGGGRGSGGGGSSGGGGGASGSSGGGSSRPSAPSAPSAPSTPPAASSALRAAQGYQASAGASSAAAKKDTNKSDKKDKPGKSSTPATSSKSPADKAKALTQQAKTMIAGATSSGIADPGAYKKILEKLKGLGKSSKVESLQKQKKQTISKLQPTGVTQPTDTDSDQTSSTGISLEDLEAYGEGLTSKFEDLLSNQDQGLTAEDVQGMITNAQASQQQPSDTSTDESSKFDLDSFLTVGQEDFDPDRFRSLLGELESSRYRQKLWNESSAKAAYKY